MAKRNPNVLKAKSGNPFIHVPFSRTDLGAVEGGGGGAKLLVDVTPQYRQSLVTKLNTAQTHLIHQIQRYPNSLGTVVLKLREKGIAKSHRPIKLAAEAGLEPAGHAKIDEMLVAAHAGSFTALESIILSRDVKEINANLSVIEDILPWSVERRVPGGLEELSQHDNVLVRLFRYTGLQANTINYDSAISIFDTLGLIHEEIDQIRGLPLIRLRGVLSLSEINLTTLVNYPGIRYIIPEPKYSLFPVNSLSHSTSAINNFDSPNGQMPIVAVFDTGVSPLAISLTPWIVGNDPYVLPPDTSYEHGTMVASLISGAKKINNGHSWIPDTRSLVYDVCGLDENGSFVSDLELRLSAAVAKRPDIKIWNLSLGGETCKEQSFSDFAMTLDKISDKHDVLFIVAAGNYEDLPRRGWPSHASLSGDRISSPGEAVRALTVGSLAHMDGVGAMVSQGQPAPYSRRGPGPVFTPKPDVIHAGGGVHAPWTAGSSSLNVIGPNDILSSGFGTSFAAPIVSSLAAHTWNSINQSSLLKPSPSLIKGLIIHSAQLSSPDYTTAERRYYGSGRPEGVLQTLFDTDDSFTLVFQTLLVPGMRWRKDAYPIPASLISDGKFKGEIVITATYAPPLDPNAGSEYVRANVELSFGLIENNRMKGKVPMEGEDGQSGYESAQIEHGGKWSPVKIHRKVFPNGIAGDVWGIQAKATLRAYEPPLLKALPVTIIVTLRSLDGNTNVHADGLRALASRNWVNNTLPNRIPITV